MEKKETIRGEEKSEKEKEEMERNERKRKQQRSYLMHTPVNTHLHTQSKNEVFINSVQKQLLTL